MLHPNNHPDLVSPSKDIYNKNSVDKTGATETKVVEPDSRPGALGLKLVRPMMGVVTYPGRGVPPPAQAGGMGSTVSSSIGVWGGAPGANALLRWKNSESYAKKSGVQEAFIMVPNDISLIIISHIVYTRTICGRGPDSRYILANDNY